MTSKKPFVVACIPDFNEERTVVRGMFISIVCFFCLVFGGLANG
jgi:hypothetical protein